MEEKLNHKKINNNEEYDSNNTLKNVILEDEFNLKEKDETIYEENELDDDSVEEEIPTFKEEEIKELIELFQKEPKKLYNLLNKIIKLENQVIDLKEKNKELTKNNIHNDSKLKKMAYVGLRRKYTMGIKEDKEMQITELLKEKSDLQEINENMLNMLTEKELENQDLQTDFQNYKNDIKFQTENYLEIIENLETKISEAQNSKENYDKKLDNIVEEYNKSKQNMENALRQSIRKEEQLNDELYKKEKYIDEIKNDMENLKIENNQLKNLNEQNKKEHNSELNDINSIIIEKPTNNYYKISGEKIKKMLGYTNLNTEKGMNYFQKFLKDEGIIKELKSKGMVEGDTVDVAGIEWIYYD